MKSEILAGKTIVITGASSGVGKAMAIELAQHAANLILTARRAHALEDTVNECVALGGKAIAIPADISSLENVKALVERAHELSDSIDVWINNAGVLAAGAFEDIPAEVNEQVIKVNLLGYMNAAHCILPYFKNRGHGILINNISVGGWFPVPYGVAYSASKFGLRGFSEALKGELTKYPGIHVCDLYPGFLDTPGIQHAANYTGKTLMPAPPVLDTQLVADAVLSLILHPQPKKTIGFASAILKTSYQTMPCISRTMTGSIIRTYLKKAEELEKTSGNVLVPVEYGTSVDGGWKPKLARKVGRKAIYLAAGFIGLTVGWKLVRS